MAFPHWLLIHASVIQLICVELVRRSKDFHSNITLFSYDCLDIFWRILSIPKPVYQSEERTHIQHYPSITGYRLLVSATVIVFGVMKMIFSYMGQNTAVNAVDWVFAVIISTSLYLLGLYEDNNCGILPFLFSADYSDPLEDILYGASFLTAYILVAAACVFYIFWMKPSITYIDIYSEELFGHPFIDNIYNRSLELFLSSFVSGGILLPIPLVLFLLWKADCLLLFVMGYFFVHKDISSVLGLCNGSWCVSRIFITYYESSSI
ncbi:hypothetical protein BJ912DRAFT_256283 [Pholiota molesta]|nr:hypothetical protein BJ912DRAFT_256283 [Pholiota molesta]